MLSPARRALVLACTVHVLHDGYSDLLYVLMPIWKHEFALSLAAVGLLRTLYSGATASLQIPVALLAERVGGVRLLTLGTAFAGGCFLIAGSGGTYVALALALVLGGLGASVQHPIASSIVARAFTGARSRAALGTYNFSGDVGKMALPALGGMLLTVLPWRNVLWIVGLLGIVVAAGTAVAGARGVGGRADVHGTHGTRAQTTGHTRWLNRSFAMLLAMGALDSATRTGFLAFLPFILTGKGASIAFVGMYLTLVFAGGAAGKFVCGYLGTRLGVLGTVVLTETCTALGILVLLVLPLNVCVLILPLIGIALNGTSSVLYGTIPELVPPARRERAFSVFYTAGIGAGALAPIGAGALGDWHGVPFAMVVVALLVTTTIPLALGLNSVLRERPALGASGAAPR